MTNLIDLSSESDLPQEDKDRAFVGPLFVVGMQRSGTKLLRALLNEHPQIRILSAETHFLPHWVKTWDSFGDLSDPLIFANFYQQMQKCPYFILTKNRDCPARQQGWYNMCRTFTPAGVYEALMRYDTSVDYSSTDIWGDKSTAYIYHLPLLKTLFPQAKVIHIVRDVRDYCLSQNKAWGKHMKRAAQRWVDGITKAKTDAQKFPQDYLEIKYEDLLQNPEEQLKICCDFLGIESTSEMLTLSRSPENIGDAKGYEQIKTDNRKKYLAEMNPRLRQSIEAVAGKLLHELNYETDFPSGNNRLSKLEMVYYRLLDGINFFLYEGTRKGFFNTLRIELGSYMAARTQK